MLDNTKLNSRIKKILKEVRTNWNVTTYRIAVEAKIPHSSLKYMVDGKFEWKLNHLLSFVEFLNLYGANISLNKLLDFENKIPFSEIIDKGNIDFRPLYFKVKFEDKIPQIIIKPKKIDPKESEEESKELAKEINEIFKNSLEYKKYKISVNIKVRRKNFDYQKEINN